ncbi:MAG: bifunctional DNA-formamidopyrimidine glycosylase/DNA-(apurinic or apyrimidinic site) lyase [Actinomycetota bacterium]|nr:bifunctional DNA-formamidopyrimidine glycosylase/DNA-(apurinic or apyrimidinic site) lyase [Actinomycetota bacterium]
MPELPEVETIRRQLEPGVVGRRIVGARVLDTRWSRPEPPLAVEAEVKGRAIESVGRRGKYLILSLAGDRHLVMHLRMTGNVLLRPADFADDGPVDLAETRLGMDRLYESRPDARFLRAAFDLDDGSELWFTDARRFGHGAVFTGAGLERYLEERLGVEPLGVELTPEYLAAQAAGRTVPLKSFLLDQRRVAGIGNIYADEALHRAELHPLSPAGSMRPVHCEALVEGIVAALELGLVKGGSSIDDYRDSRGERGSMQDEFLVHTREGRECGRCSGEIRRIVVGGRSTYFCPDCQVRLRRRRKRRSR